jgi:hypothetical protein
MEVGGAAKDEAAAAASSRPQPATEKKKAARPGPVEYSRGAPPELPKARSVRPSLFASRRLDVNRDGKIQPNERILIHQRVPQFILISVEENGSVEGLELLREELVRHGIWGKATFFMTANYLSGRKNYLGGDIDAFWQTLVFENYIGLMGTSYEPGGQRWTLEQWQDENATAQDEIITRLRLPRRWEWSRYPFGSRSPYFVVTEMYLQSLKRLKYRILYDSSLVMEPREIPRPGTQEVRDLPWPFTLDHPLPEDVIIPAVTDEARRGALRTKELWEIPVYAWYLQPAGSVPSWQPPVDQTLWAFNGCSGETANAAVVDDVLSNLKAHYRGNRVPFMFGLRPQNYVRDEACKRATLAAVLDKIDELISKGYNIRYTSMPDLLTWMDWMSRR